jgi:hypothetical protein
LNPLAALYSSFVCDFSPFIAHDLLQYIITNIAASVASLVMSNTVFFSMVWWSPLIAKLWQFQATFSITLPFTPQVAVGWLTRSKWKASLSAFMARYSMVDGAKCVRARGIREGAGGSYAGLQPQQHGKSHMFFCDAQHKQLTSVMQQSATN